MKTILFFLIGLPGFVLYCAVIAMLLVDFIDKWEDRKWRK